jgi:hypothetical protein
LMRYTVAIDLIDAVSPHPARPLVTAGRLRRPRLMGHPRRLLRPGRRLRGRCHAQPTDPA